jgi:hypothetical protein
MGAQEMNFHADVFRRLGYEEAVDRIQSLFLSGRQSDAIAAVPEAMIDEICLVGPKEKVRDDLEAWRESRVTSILVGGPIETLRQVAELVRDRSRKVDVVARYGGEEFAVILPEIDLHGAAKFGETVREMVEQTRFVFEGRHIPLTISVGVSELEPHISNADDLIQTADARLYRAKQSGRNRVVS